MLTKALFAVLNSTLKTQKYAHRQTKWDILPFGRSDAFLASGQ